jgi:F-type H+-transporting ATPase subunit b
MGELFHNFGIDWKLLLAQAVNFFVLLFLLKKFAYRPILKMLGERRKIIVKGLEDAKAAEEKMQKIEAVKDEVLADAHRQELRIMEQAEGRAREKEKEIMQEARKKSDVLVEEGKKRVEEEHAKSFEEIYKESAVLVKSALVKVFEKSPETFEDTLIEKSLKELKNLNPKL